ncbi:peptidoglycan-binding protein [Archangium violaceum]|uniref:peptidoglycan-binding domain-containing protein n=1 Tax=Archangium violaceum TaxID=83451 RepID=UPI00194F9743|nr:peptidoglycan-binding domain-containing protein [Archangium violaceum]QRN95917.1 peptidoglycan-binding protein [Archangium violaceum]
MAKTKKSEVKKPTVPLLVLGSEGAEVSRLQKSLARLGYEEVGAEGIFDAATQAAVKAFQAQSTLTVYAIVDPKTRGALAAAQAGQPVGSVADRPDESEEESGEEEESEEEESESDEEEESEDEDEDEEDEEESDEDEEDESESDESDESDEEDEDGRKE